NYHNPGVSALQSFTEGLVKPGIPVLERFANRMQALQPRPVDSNLQAYLGLFDPGEVLLQQRLRAGEKGDLNESTNLELFLVSLGDEQRELGARFGFRACNPDFLSVLGHAIAQ